MSIEKIVIFKVVVAVPARTHEQYHASQRFEIDVMAASQGADRGGTDFYDAPYIWAEFDNEQAAIEADKKITEMVARYNQMVEEEDRHEAMIHRIESSQV